MGMSTSAAEDYGLYVTTEDFKEYADKNGVDADDVGYDNGFNSYGGAEGECCLIIKNGSAESFSAENSFFIASLERFPALFSRAYRNERDALLELKEKYGEFLPDDFDYEGKFVHFVGTTFG